MRGRRALPPRPLASFPCPTPNTSCVPRPRPPPKPLPQRPSPEPLPRPLRQRRPLQQRRSRPTACASKRAGGQPRQPSPLPPPRLRRAPPPDLLPPPRARRRPSSASSPRPSQRTPADSSSMSLPWRAASSGPRCRRTPTRTWPRWGGRAAQGAGVYAGVVFLCHNCVTPFLPSPQAALNMMVRTSAGDYAHDWIYSTSPG